MPPHKRDRFKKRRGPLGSPSPVETPPAREVPASRAYGEAPEADIPDLKKKEKERKGGAGLGYAGAGSGGPGIGMNLGASGVRVGSSLVSNPGILGSGRIAATLSSVLGGPSTFLGGAFAGSFGAPMVLGAMLTWGLVMGAAGLKLMGLRLGGDASTASTSASAYTPGGVAKSGIVIDKAKDGSLGYLANANQGEVLWDKEHPMAPKAVEEEDAIVDAPEGDAIETPKFEMPDVSALQQEAKGLNREGFVKKLSQSTNGGGGGGAGASLKNGLAGFDLKTGGLAPKPLIAKGAGKLSASQRARQKLGVSSLSHADGRSSRAMGQLKLSRFMSGKGDLAKPDSAARTFAADAFDQGSSIGGELGNVSEGSGIVVPAGSGAPDIGAGMGANPADLSPPPNVDPGHNVTPYQGNVDQAKNLDDQAGQNKMMSILLIAIGIALIAAGTQCLPMPGAILMAIGGALVGMGIMMMMMAQQQAGQAKDQGKEIQQEYGQDDQGGVIDECADAAAGSGTKADACKPATTTQDFNKKTENNTIKEDVDAERKSDYELINGGEGKAGGTAVP